MNNILLLQIASTEMDVVTVATEASRFPGTPVSLGTLNVLTNTISLEGFTKRFMIVAIYAAIQKGSRRMGRGVSPRIGPYAGNTVMCLNVLKDVSRLPDTKIVFRFEARVFVACICATNGNNNMQ